jgi:isopenicillin N synthase-like dioxygenase
MKSGNTSRYSHRGLWKPVGENDDRQPIPRHAICNIGDALFVFSGGILRSAMHRVVYVTICSLRLSNFSRDTPT